MYGYKADIWSYGITIYEMLLGNPPLANHGPQNVLSIIPKMRPVELTGSFSAPLKELVHLCLASEPDERPSAEELLKIKLFKHTPKDADVILRELITRHNNWAREKRRRGEKTDDELENEEAQARIRENEEGHGEEEHGGFKWEFEELDVDRRLPLAAKEVNAGPSSPSLPPTSPPSLPSSEAQGGIEGGDGAEGKQEALATPTLGINALSSKEILPSSAPMTPRGTLGEGGAGKGSEVGHRTIHTSGQHPLLRIFDAGKDQENTSPPAKSELEVTKRREKVPMNPLPPTHLPQAPVHTEEGPLGIPRATTANLNISKDHVPPTKPLGEKGVGSEERTKGKKPSLVLSSTSANTINFGGMQPSSPLRIPRASGPSDDSKDEEDLRRDSSESTGDDRVSARWP